MDEVKSFSLSLLITNANFFSYSPLCFTGKRQERRHWASSCVVPSCWLGLNHNSPLYQMFLEAKDCFTGKAGHPQCLVYTRLYQPVKIFGRLWRKQSLRIEKKKLLPLLKVVSFLLMHSVINEDAVIHSELAVVINIFNTEHRKMICDGYWPVPNKLLKLEKSAISQHRTVT